MFASLKGLIVAAGAIIALAPTASLLGGLVDLPPDFNDFLLFATGFFGPVTFFVVLLLRKRLARLKPVVRGLLIGTAAAAGMAAAWVAYEYSNRHVFHIDFRQEDGSLKRNYYVKPEPLQGRLSELVNEKYGGFWEQALIGPDRLEVEREMTSQSLPIQRTMLIYVCLAQILLLFVFLAGAWWALETVQRTRSRVHA